MRNNRWPGLFILVEGLDGSGKTTAIHGAISKLRPRLDLLYLKGVGDKTFLGSIARRFAKTFLFVIELLAVTYCHLIPALKRGRMVVMDKYYFFVASHIPDVYGFSSRAALAIAQPFLIRPDLVIYFQVDIDERIRRLKAGKWSRFHQKLIDNPQWVLERDGAYLVVIGDDAEDIAFLDTTGLTQEEVMIKLEQVILNKWRYGYGTEC